MSDPRMQELSTLCQRHLDQQRVALTATPPSRGRRGVDFIERVRAFDGPRINAWFGKGDELEPGFLGAQEGGQPKYPGAAALLGFCRDTYPAWLREHVLPAAQDQLTRASQALLARDRGAAEEAVETCANLCRGVAEWSPRLAPEVKVLYDQAQALTAAIADGSAMAKVLANALTQEVARAAAAGALLRFAKDPGALGRGQFADRFGGKDFILARLDLAAPLTETLPDAVEYYRLGVDIEANDRTFEARWTIRRRERFAAAYAGRKSVLVPLLVPDQFYEAIANGYKQDGAFADAASEIRAYQHVAATFFPAQVASALASLPDGEQLVKVGFHVFAQTGGGGPRVEARGAFLVTASAESRAFWSERASALQALGQALVDRDDEVRRREQHVAADAALDAKTERYSNMTEEERKLDDEATLHTMYQERLMNHSGIRAWTDIHGRQFVDVWLRAPATRRDGDLVTVALVKDGKTYVDGDTIRRPPDGESKKTYEITGWGSGTWSAVLTLDAFRVMHSRHVHW